MRRDRWLLRHQKGAGDAMRETLFVATPTELALLMAHIADLVMNGDEYAAVVAGSIYKGNTSDFDDVFASVGGEEAALDDLRAGDFLSAVFLYSVRASEPKDATADTAAAKP